MRMLPPINIVVAGALASLLVPRAGTASARVWGVHNLGATCLNAGVHMSRICADAGPLLTCSSTL